MSVSLDAEAQRGTDLSSPNDILYGASKHAVLGLTRSLAPKVYHEGITINALAPSIVRTALGPKEFFDAMEVEGRVTPMSTLTACVDTLLDGNMTGVSSLYPYLFVRLIALGFDTQG
jgi:NAD(P)-dependent dehydrogenase (short-subunit alcohol dehydrogenase family)